MLNKLLQPKTLLWIDAFAASLSAVIVLSLRYWFSPIFNLSVNLLTIMGVITLIYAPYSFYLATRSTVRVTLVKVLVGGNFAYGALCFVMMLFHFQSASPWGVFYFAFDFVCVVLLAYLEYDKIVRPSPGTAV